MLHNDDSSTEHERIEDERPETVSIGELLRSAHSVSHRLMRHVLISNSNSANPCQGNNPCWRGQRVKSGAVATPAITGVISPGAHARR